MRFAVYDAQANCNLDGGPLTNSITPVTNGLFTVTLDFGGSVFIGPDRWLEIGVRTNGSSSDYATLTPRQALTPTPYAIRAANLNGLSVQVNGTSPNLLGGSDLRGKQ